MEWYKHYPDRFACGTANLTLKEIGAYILLLDAMYDRNGPLPDDDIFIRRILHCHGNEWLWIKRSLIKKGKIWISSGNLWGKRVGKELEKFKKRSKFNGNRHTEDRKKKNYSSSNSSSSFRSEGPARSLAVVPSAHSPAPSTDRKESKMVRTFGPLRRDKHEIVFEGELRIIRNAGAVPTVTKNTPNYPDGLPIGIDGRTGIPLKPGKTDQLMWEPQYHRVEHLLDCRPPWERNADEEYQRDVTHKSQFAEPGQIFWSEVPAAAKVYSLNDPENKSKKDKAETNVDKMLTEYHSKIGKPKKPKYDPTQAFYTDDQIRKMYSQKPRLPK